MSKRRINVQDIINRKGKTPLVCLTCYTHPYAQIFDDYTDILLVGDTLGMVLYGMDSTLQVDLNMMINHAKAVVKGSKKSLVIVDMPFGTCQESEQVAFKNAVKIIRESGCTAVKIEGGEEMASTIKFLTQRGIPVVAHIGLMPQHINSYNGYKFHGSDKAQQKKIINDALAVEKAGAFAVVVECVSEKLAQIITDKVSIPTIGIGASAKCDGQVLVCEDMLGIFNDFVPKFVKKYGNLSDSIRDCVSKYSKEVKDRKFPSKEYTFNA
jgi:3-methyl-2-oxobutanoate hydroxymethyltransferase